MEYLVVLTILLCSLYTRKLETSLPPPSSEFSLALSGFSRLLIGQVDCLTHQDSDGQGADNAGTIYVGHNTTFVPFLSRLSFLSIIRGQRSLVSLRINAPVMEPDGRRGVRFNGRSRDSCTERRGRVTFESLASQDAVI